MTLKIYLYLIFSFFYFSSINAQPLKIDTSFTTKDYINKILKNDRIKVNNISIKGLKSSIGYFEFDTNVVGIKKGIVLSTGNANNINNGNKTPGTSGLAWNNKLNFKSDKDLNSLAKGRVCDQIILEFDFIPLDNFLKFKYLFASEEYKEYVGSRFNDVFGFVITGENNFRKNIAVFSSSNLPVTINNINHIKNSSLYINNNCFEKVTLNKQDEYLPRKPFIKSVLDKFFGNKNKDFKINIEEKSKLNSFLFENFEFDGLTKPLEAKIYLTPYKVYHMKIAIGDVGDPMYDSGVFIEGGSLESIKDSSVANFTNYKDISNLVDFDSLFKYRYYNPIVVDSPPQIDDQYELTNINFDFNEIKINDSNDIKIRELALYLNKNKDYKLHLLGYTDNVGGLEYNQRLSEKRAKVVKSLLIKSGVEESRINYIGNNYENPLMSNESEIGRKINRRVEIIVLD